MNKTMTHDEHRQLQANILNVRRYLDRIAETLDMCRGSKRGEWEMDSERLKEHVMISSPDDIRTDMKYMSEQIEMMSSELLDIERDTHDPEIPPVGAPGEVYELREVPLLEVPFPRPEFRENF